MTVERHNAAPNRIADSGTLPLPHLSNLQHLLVFRHEDFGLQTSACRTDAASGLRGGRWRFNPELRNRNGSARVPRARSGVAPELRRSNQNLGEVEKFVGRNFRRDAENHTPEACATKNLPARLVSISELGLNPRRLPVSCCWRSSAIAAGVRRAGRFRPATPARRRGRSEAIGARCSRSGNCAGHHC